MFLCILIQSSLAHSIHRVYVQYILHDNNLMQYNNACIIIMSGFNVGLKKKYPLSKGHPPYKANLRPAEEVAL